uniref:Polyprotein n=1 Tax=Haemonchus placei TaxID=6290 RepID=A0A0N4X1I2_HAEPC
LAKLESRFELSVQKHVQQCSPYLKWPLRLGILPWRAAVLQFCPPENQLDIPGLPMPGCKEMNASMMVKKCRQVSSTPAYAEKTPRQVWQELNEYVDFHCDEESCSLILKAIVVDGVHDLQPDATIKTGQP